MKKSLILLSLAALTLLAPFDASARHPQASHSSAAQESGTPGVFDYYVLSLSWSPEHCEEVPSDHSQQCASGSNQGFVLHGLWPQYTVHWPHNCTDAPLPDDAWSNFPDVFPSQKLMQHEWSTHGTCTGLSPEDYIALAKRLHDSVSIPSNYAQSSSTFMTTSQSLLSAFAGANSQLVAGGMTVNCSGAQHAWLQEVHICLDKTGASVACSADEVQSAQRSCPAETVKVLGSE